MSPIAAGVYARISVDDGTALGVQRQLKDCRELAERKGWSVVEEFVDNSVGAWGTRRRPEYQRMLQAMKDGHIDAVIVWHLDRLTRRPVELEGFFEAADAAGIKDLATVTGDVDLSTHDGRFMARILGAVARKESDDKSRRTRRKHLELAEAGMPVGAGRPFGYENDRITIRPEEAELIREAARRILAGDSLRGVCMDWQERGVVTTRGRAWRQTALRRVMLSHRIAGKRSLGVDGPVLATAVWPAIVDEDAHRRLRVLLTDPGRHVSGFGARTYLLGGFLFCARCTARLVSRAQSKGAQGRHRRTYICSKDPLTGGCGGIRIVADPLEALVVEEALHALSSPALARAIVQAADEAAGAEEDIAGELATIEAALEQLARDHYADAVIGRGEYLAARQALDGRLDALRRRMGRDRRSAVLLGLDPEEGALQAAWEGFSLDRRRAILRAVIERIEVRPATPGLGKFDPGRITVTWRA